MSSNSQKKTRPTKPSLQGVAQSYVPLFLNQLPEPVTTLMHYVDVDRLFCEQALEVDTDSNKKKSLRLLLGTSGSLKSKKARPGDTPSTSIDKVTSIRIQCQVHRLCEHLNNNQETFVRVAALICGLDDSEIRKDLYLFAPFLMLDYSVSQHPCLRHLGISDIQIYIRCGQAELESYLLRRTAAEALSYANAAARMKRILQYASTFASERGGKSLVSALPIGWNLHPSTHVELDEREIGEQTQRIMREFPLLLIGVFAFMDLHQFKQKIIDGLIRSFI